MLSWPATTRGPEREREIGVGRGREENKETEARDAENEVVVSKLCARQCRCETSSRKQNSHIDLQAGPFRSGNSMFPAISDVVVVQHRTGRWTAGGLCQRSGTRALSPFAAASKILRDTHVSRTWPTPTHTNARPLQSGASTGLSRCDGETPAADARTGSTRTTIGILYKGRLSGTALAAARFHTAA